MSLSSDIWESDSEEQQGAGVQGESVEIKKLRTIHSKRGYVDGITASKEQNLQEGFDASYEQGGLLGKRAGRVLGELQMLDMLYGGENKQIRSDLKDAQQELRINKVLSTRNFDEQCNFLSADNNPIEKWEKTVAAHRERHCS